MSGDQYDAPNQQVVRADGSGPAEEGTGGAGDQPAGGGEAGALDDMTKAQLLDEAQGRGVDVDESMTKAEIKDAIEAG